MRIAKDAREVAFIEALAVSAEEIERLLAYLLSADRVFAGDECRDGVAHEGKGFVAREANAGAADVGVDDDRLATLASRFAMTARVSGNRRSRSRRNGRNGNSHDNDRCGDRRRGRGDRDRAGLPAASTSGAGRCWGSRSNGSDGSDGRDHRHFHRSRSEVSTLFCGSGGFFTFAASATATTATSAPATFAFFPVSARDARCRSC